MRAMKTTIFAVLIGAVLLSCGCVKTVNDRTTAGMPIGKDTKRSRYPRSVDQVFDAAKAVVLENGVLLRTGEELRQPNAFKSLQGKINERSVYISVTAVEPNLSELAVQARTSGGGGDVESAAEIDKLIALKLK
jgi:hypothetical protein